MPEAEVVAVLLAAGLPEIDGAAFPSAAAGVVGPLATACAAVVTIAMTGPVGAGGVAGWAAGSALAGAALAPDVEAV
uniref:hypothetical protein n=1 Tax=Acidocella sp. C78 TaxID=1671486 RepID=UPI00191BBC14|nr:hypothetical protein [Acidocella sp. C78]